MDDHELARDLADEAGRLLLELRAAGGDPGVLRKAGDRLSHEFLTAELAARRPGDMVLSEEAADDLARLSADRVWIVDPLDGTNEFGDVPRTDWAVHVALWERRFGLVTGAVALPAQGKTLSTVSPPPLPEGDSADSDSADSDSADSDRADGTVRVVVSRSRAPQFVRHMGLEVATLGSAGAKVAAVLLGEADAYIHAGGFYEWDTAAPVAVARAAGFHASRIDGSELLYNQANLLLPDILVCRPALAGRLLTSIEEILHATQP